MVDDMALSQQLFNKILNEWLSHPRGRFCDISFTSLSTKTTTIPHMPPTLTINNLAGRDGTGPHPIINHYLRRRITTTFLYRLSQTFTSPNNSITRSSSSAHTQNTLLSVNQSIKINQRLPNNGRRTRSTEHWRLRGNGRRLRELRILVEVFLADSVSRRDMEHGFCCGVGDCAFLNS